MPQKNIHMKLADVERNVYLKSFQSTDNNKKRKFIQADAEILNETHEQQGFACFF